MGTPVSPEAFVKGLSCWKGPVICEPLGGGITNVNFVVTDMGAGEARYVARVGDDIPVHQIMRFNELAASKAAEAVGISPRIFHHEPGVLVIEYIDGTTLTPEAVAAPENLELIIPLIKRCHRDVPKFLRGPALVFWVFHILRDYAASLEEGESNRTSLLPDLLGAAAVLEKAVGAVDLVYGHNDLLAANFIRTDDRIWLIDWDYGGFNSPLFDLGGLASNNGLTRDQEAHVLETYFERAPDDALWHRYEAMKCASLLREAMWSMISEIHSGLDFDYRSYTEDYLERFRSAYAKFLSM